MADEIKKTDSNPQAGRDNEAKKETTDPANATKKTVDVL